MSTLHTVNKNQEHAKFYDDIKLAINNGDAVLLIEDGCYALTDTYLIKQLESVSGNAVLALLSDATARGLARTLVIGRNTDHEITTLARGISYQEFVQESLAHDKTISWF